MTAHGPKSLGPNPADGFRDGPVAWLLPFLSGSWPSLFRLLTLVVATLLAAAYMPLFIESMLHHGHVDTQAIAVLISLILIQILGGHLLHRGAHHVSVAVIVRLSDFLFDAILHARGAKQRLRSDEQIARMLGDIEHVAEAVEKTIVSGIPGVVRLLQSLVLLTYISREAGMVMAGGTVLFLIFRAYIGKRMWIADKERLDARSGVGQLIDEFLTKSRTAAGLSIEAWMMKRLDQRLETLESKSHALGERLAQLSTAAHAAGLAGIFTVVLVAARGGASEIAVAAASLLYVEGVVKGLESLPVWVRSLQLAAVARYRMNEIVSDRDGEIIPTLQTALGKMDWALEGVIGLVTSSPMTTDEVLAQMSADASDGSQWRINTFGHIVRLPDYGRGIIHVPEEAETFLATVREHFQAADPAITEAEMRVLLIATGAEHLLNSPVGADALLSPHGLRLSADERQRMLIAIALAAKPQRLLLGELHAFEDLESAEPLLREIRSRVPLTVLAIRSAELAENVDQVMWVHGDHLEVSDHRSILVGDPAYAQIWGKRLNANAIDLSVLGIDSSNTAAVEASMRTERYEAGEVIYRQGEPANRVFFIISGRVEILSADADGKSKRVAILGAGNHCGDLTLSVGERRAETAIASEGCVIRTVSRDAISVGMVGMLDRTPAERKILAMLLRQGSGSRAELAERLPELDAETFKRALDLLIQDSAVVLEGDVVRLAKQRSSRRGSRELLDRLGDF